MKPFLNKIMDSVTNATNPNRVGKSVLAATQHAENQAAEKHSFQSVLKSAQQHFQNAKPASPKTTEQVEKTPSKEIAKQPAVTNENEAITTSSTEQEQPTNNDAQVSKDALAVSTPSEKVKATQAIASDMVTTVVDASKTMPAPSINIEQLPIEETETQTTSNDSHQIESLSDSDKTDTDETADLQTILNASITAPIINPTIAIDININQSTPIHFPDASSSADNVSDIARINTETSNSPITNTSNTTSPAISNSVSPEANATFNNLVNTSQTASSTNALSEESKAITLDSSAWQPITPQEISSALIAPSQVQASVNTEANVAAPVTTNAISEKMNPMVASTLPQMNASVAPDELNNSFVTNDTSNTTPLSITISMKQTTELPAPKPEVMDTTDAIALNPQKTQNDKNSSEITAQAVTSTINTNTLIDSNKPVTEAVSSILLAPVPILPIQSKEIAPTETPVPATIVPSAVASESISASIAAPDLKTTKESNIEPKVASNKPSALPEKHSSDTSVKPFMAAATHQATNHSSNQTDTSDDDTSENESKTDAVISQSLNFSTSSVDSSNSANTTAITANTKEIGSSDLKDLLSIQASGGTASEQVTNGIQEGLRINRPEIVIRLSPEDLGDVNIRLSSNAQQQITAHLMVSNPETQDLLDKQIHQLKHSLESQGIQIEHISVTVAEKADNQSGQFNQSNSQEQSSYQDKSGQQQFSNQQAFQQQQQAQQLYQQFNQNNSQRFSTQAGQDASNGIGTLEGLNQQVTSINQPEIHNPNGSISLFA